MAIDILHCYEEKPKIREYVLPGLLPGKVGAMVSPGGLGKSILSLMLSHVVAGGADLLGLERCQTGRVVYLSAEDDAEILHSRLHAIGRLLTEEQRGRCVRNLLVEDLTSHMPDMLGGNGRAWRESIENLATGSRLLFLDTLRSFHAGDENDASLMSVLIGHMRGIASRTGCAIIFLHHTSKWMSTSGQGDAQQASRGSSVLTDNIRWQSYLVAMSENEAKRFCLETSEKPIGVENRHYYVRFGISKHNYGGPINDKWFRRGNEGIFESVNLSVGVKKERENRKRGDVNV
ncbi:plasmid and phage replicative helicase [Methylomagnum ishizawai]|uniref:Plasmid and phage replicative helicase n=1 Tax=Methylomagnum ishizawai TaxID=1760988 RepID=A0A1Y6DEL4_9GAMM|nr:helicase RepA family protein [Methylomagnum ishizawai]SMF97865.1 plasmid and phage replicative helicase [Methylomagnum ishizawai]